MGAKSKTATRPTFAYERECRRSGFQHVAGVDEAGRGALAGPVVAAAVVLPDTLPEDVVANIDDSKRLSSGQRERAFAAIIEAAESHGVGVVDADRIDQIGIVPATKLAMCKAVGAAQTRIDFLLIDAVTNIGIATPSKSIIRGDSQSLSIAAASIVAKVTRDRIMANDMESRYPGYGFAKHKGYGTAFHLDALERLGPSNIHRRTFKPVAQHLADRTWSALGNTASSNIEGSTTLRLPGGIGRNAEDAVVRHIEQLGYRILARNVKSRRGEIDIIADHDGVMAFIEVKARNSSQFGAPIESLTPHKLRRLQSAAIAYLASEVGTEDIDWRIDFAGVERSADGRSLEIEIVPNVSE